MARLNGGQQHVSDFSRWVEDMRRFRQDHRRVKWIVAPVDDGDPATTAAPGAATTTATPAPTTTATAASAAAVAGTVNARHVFVVAHGEDVPLFLQSVSSWWQGEKGTVALDVVIR